MSPSFLLAGSDFNQKQLAIKKNSQWSNMLFCLDTHSIRKLSKHVRPACGPFQTFHSIQTWLLHVYVTYMYMLRFRMFQVIPSKHDYYTYVTYMLCFRMFQVYRSKYHGCPPVTTWLSAKKSSLKLHTQTTMLFRLLPRYTCAYYQRPDMTLDEAQEVSLWLCLWSGNHQGYDKCHN